MSDDSTTQGDIRTDLTGYWRQRIRAWRMKADTEAAPAAEIKLLMMCFDHGIFGTAGVGMAGGPDTLALADSDELNFKSQWLSRGTDKRNGSAG